jgi:hypothetical protein
MGENKKEVWGDVQYRIEAEGFHYCFEWSSSWEEIKDENFHKLRRNYLEAAKALEDYVSEKAAEEYKSFLN